MHVVNAKRFGREVKAAVGIMDEQQLHCKIMQPPSTPTEAQTIIKQPSDHNPNDLIKATPSMTRHQAHVLVQGATTAITIVGQLQQLPCGGIGFAGMFGG